VWSKRLPLRGIREFAWASLETQLAGVRRGELPGCDAASLDPSELVVHTNSDLALSDRPRIGGSAFDPRATRTNTGFPGLSLRRCAFQASLVWLCWLRVRGSCPASRSPKFDLTARPITGIGGRARDHPGKQLRDGLSADQPPPHHPAAEPSVIAPSGSRNPTTAAHLQPTSSAPESQVGPTKRPALPKLPRERSSHIGLPGKISRNHSPRVPHLQAQDPRLGVPKSCPPLPGPQKKTDPKTEACSGKAPVLGGHHRPR
jgi:hypothetical protein